MKKNKVIIIGSGFSSLSAACYLAKNGKEVTVVEKNNQLGGRAVVWKNSGFTFDMGPSWYWMKDVFDNFFADFNHSSEDFYELKKLDPGFRMVFNPNFEKKDFIDLPADINQIYKVFYELEKESGNENGSIALKSLLDEGKVTYQNALDQYMLKVSKSIFEFADVSLISSFIKGGLLKSYGNEINKRFTNEKIQKLLNFPVLFLGASSKDIPFLYNLMPYSMITGGTYYPMGGMWKIVEAMCQIASNLGVKFITNCEVKELEIKNGSIKSIIVLDKTPSQQGESTGFEFAFAEHEKISNQKNIDKNYLRTENLFQDTPFLSINKHLSQENITKLYKLTCDNVVCGADYNHFEQNIIPKKYRLYNQKYWDKQKLSPSSLIAYVGVNKKLNNLHHHNLFFDTDLDKHQEEIYKGENWPTDPLFYVSCPSKTDFTTAPNNCENLFFLMPIAPNLNDANEDEKEKYFNLMLNKVEQFCNESNLAEKLIVKRLYSVQNFKDDYFSFKGNAYGHANTLLQTAIFKPKMINKKLKNLVFCGQLTVPGPGIPPTIISGKIASSIVLKKDIHSL